MKINKIYKLLVAFSAITVLSVTSCTDKFEEINTSPYGVSNESLTQEFNHLGGRIVQATQNIYSVTPAWLTQLQQNLIGDVYSGYMTPPTPFAGNVNNMTYSLVNGWNGFPWSTAYSSVMFPLATMEETAGDDFPQFVAWSKIIRVEAMHRVADIYGPIIYSNFGKDPALYDSQKDVYKLFIDDLDEAITTLKEYTDFAGFFKFDLVYGGDVTKWIQFANSLKLRLAIRMSKVDPDYAQTVGESALADEIGLLTDNASNFTLSPDVGDHPLNTINNGWGDIRMSAEMESILTGYDDPRLGAYFVPTQDESINPNKLDIYKGIRMGIEIEAKDTYGAHSALTTFGGIQLMTSAEVQFLKAEASLRGWDGAGDAEANYEAGIALSFEQHGVGGATAAYIADNTSVPAEFIDAVNSDNDVKTGDPNLSTITIAWDDAASDDEKLERIITQKWIAMYPDGQEAWSEFRRTGYPKLFPVVVNNSGGTIDTDEQIKRINFPEAEGTTNPEGLASGVSALGGADNGGSAVWWDVD